MSDPYIGEIRIFAGTFAPEGWLLCDGSTQNIANYEALYSLIGTTYGGSGATFALPNLKGRLAVGFSKAAGTPYSTMGASGGADQVTLQTANLPAHTHSLFASSSNATTGVAGPTVTTATASSPYHMYVNTAISTGTYADLNANALGYSNGGNQPHDNIMPSLTLNYIICWQGLYPSN